MPLAICCKKELPTACSEAFEVGKDNIQISHLQYANDIMVFISVDKAGASNLMKSIGCFEMVSKLNINWDRAVLLA